MIEGLRYKLHMMGIPIDGPASVFCDNNSVVPESQLKKKHNAIAYHRTREACAAETIRRLFESHIRGRLRIWEIFYQDALSCAQKVPSWTLSVLNWETVGFGHVGYGHLERCYATS
jgi:hypothetical protein